MTVLLDTHAWIWLLESPEYLPKEVARMLRDPANLPLGLAAISPWEVAKKAEHGKLQFAIPTLDWLLRATQNPGIRLLPLTPRISCESCSLPKPFHRDPADQIIVATARVHGLTLITRDERILAYPHVHTLWR
jgi:PIN domain nuclease of toxin-antitoxin system